MKTKIISIAAAASVALLSAACHHHDRDYYRPGPSHHYHHGDGWHNGQNRPTSQPRPHYATTGQPAYPYLYQLQ